MNSKLRELIQDARKACNMKQKEVAQLMGLRGSTISNWENGVSDPDIDEFVQLCSIYNVDFSSILIAAYGDPTKNIPPLDYDARERSLILKYRSLDKRGKETVDRLVDSQCEMAKSKLSESSSETSVS